MSAYRMPRDREAFSLDLDRKTRRARKEERGHLDFIRSLPCAICNSRRAVEAAHLRFGDPDYGKPKTGMGTRPDDKYALPLCAEHHRIGPDAQHSEHEQTWWNERGIDPVGLALKLHNASGDELACEHILNAVRGPHRRDFAGRPTL